MVYYPEHVIVCSFCGKSQKQVERLIAGPNIHICNECICVAGHITHPDVVSHDEEMKLRMFNEQVAKAYKDYLMIIRLVTGKKTWNDDSLILGDEDEDEK